jgi:hypothetical protein
MSSNVHALELSKAFLNASMTAYPPRPTSKRLLGRSSDGQATIPSVLGCSTPQLASCGPFENFLPAITRIRRRS